MVQSHRVRNHGQIRVEQRVSHGLLETLVFDDRVEALLLQSMVQVYGKSLQAFEDNELHVFEFGCELGGPEVRVLDVFLTFVLA